MTVRTAKFVDTPRVIELMHEAHQRSIYADIATFDELTGKQLCARAIQRHGHTNLGGMLYLVSENDGQVNGFMIGLLDSVYPCLAELMATDIVFYFSEGGRLADAARIVQQIIAWGRSAPKCIEVHLGATSAIGDWERTAKLYQRIGLEQCGGMFRMPIEQAKQEAVGS